MPIPFGQPVEEITRSVEGMKIGGHMRLSENTGKPQMQKGSALSSPDVVSVQAHCIGHEPTSGEMVAHSQSLEASAVEAGNVVPASSWVLEQQGNQIIEPVVFSAEQFSQHPYVGMAYGHLQGPVQTGYPAPYTDPHNYYPYYMGGDIYNTPVTSVYNQNYFYSVSGVDPYNIAYSGQYGYPQYHVAPVEQYSVTQNSLPCAMASESPLSGAMVLTPYGYSQPTNISMEHGQWVPMMPMYTPTVVGENLSNFGLVPYPLTCVPGVSNLQSADCDCHPNPQNAAIEPDGSKCGAPIPKLKSANFFSKETYATTEEIGDKLYTVENKKPFKKQLSLFYGPPAPVKGSWVRPGHLQYLSAGHPFKAFNGQTVSSGMPASNTQTLLKADLNLESFSLDFEDAKHFVIKSFSEENVVKSIQHGVWASTVNGNKKLDEAFKDAQGRSKGKGKGCPVFLYFSVNGSGRFCGVAEMVGGVDYNNTMDFWERNRWSGSFPVKWLFVKDVPHSLLRRIILHNNENKPVISSRDTQEVNFEQGMQMLSIIKNSSTKSSILDTPLYLQRVTPHEAVVQPLSCETVGQLPSLELRKKENSFGDKNVPADATQQWQDSPHTPVLESKNAAIALNGEAGACDAQLHRNQSEDRERKNIEKQNMLLGSAAAAAVGV